MRNQILFILIFFVMGCVENSSDYPTEKISELDPYITKDTISTSPLRVTQNGKLEIGTVNLDQIKSKYVKSNTTGLISKKESIHFQSKAQDEFMGIYYFIGKESSIPYLGQAIVAVTIPIDKWNYYNKDERLLEFTIFSNELNPFYNIIKIGDTEKALIGIFGSNFKCLNSTLIYEQEGNEIASFLLTDNKVMAIRVGLYNDITQIPPIKYK